MKWTRTSLQVEFTSRVYRIFTSLRKLSSLITLTLYEIVTIIQRQVDVPVVIEALATIRSNCLCAENNKFSLIK